MKHLFVETNWVVACCAPSHARDPSAERLLQRAREGAWELHVPAVCLREAVGALQERYQPRVPEDIRRFIRAAREQGMVSPDSSQNFFSMLNLYHVQVESELDSLEDRLEALCSEPGVDVFALSDEMLQRAVQLRTDLPGRLRPFDEAILAAVLVRARALREQGADDVVFCTLDSDLHPWTRDDDRREALAALYGEAGVWVNGDFRLEKEVRPLAPTSSAKPSAAP